MNSWQLVKREFCGDNRRPRQRDIFRAATVWRTLQQHHCWADAAEAGQDMATDKAIPEFLRGRL